MNSPAKELIDRIDKANISEKIDFAKRKDTIAAIRKFGKLVEKTHDEVEKKKLYELSDFFTALGNILFDIQINGVPVTLSKDIPFLIEKIKAMDGLT